jgi:hypothetical protein
MTAPPSAQPAAAGHPDPTAPAGPPRSRRWPALSAVAAPAVLASPESTAETGMKFVGLIIGLTLLWAAIRAMFGRKR